MSLYIVDIESHYEFDGEMVGKITGAASVQQLYEKAYSEGYEKGWSDGHFIGVHERRDCNDKQ